MVHAMLKISTPPKLTKEYLDRIQKQELEFLNFVCALVEKDSSYFRSELALKGLEESKITNLVNDLVEDLIPIKPLTHAIGILLEYHMEPMSILSFLASSEEVIIKNHGRYVQNEDNEVCITFTYFDKYYQDLKCAGRVESPVPYCLKENTICSKRTL